MNYQYNLHEEAINNPHAFLQAAPVQATSFTHTSKPEWFGIIYPSTSQTAGGTTSNGFIHNSDPQAVANEFWQRPWMRPWHLLQRPMSWPASISFVGKLTKDTIPALQRGHGTEPGGADISELMLLVEQRHSAHFVQSSWPQPANQEKKLIAHGSDLLFSLIEIFLFMCDCLPAAATVQVLSKQTAHRSLSSQEEVEEFKPFTLHECKCISCVSLFFQIKNCGPVLLRAQEGFLFITVNISWQKILFVCFYIQVEGNLRDLEKIFYFWSWR